MGGQRDTRQVANEEEGIREEVAEELLKATAEAKETAETATNAAEDAVAGATGIALTPVNKAAVAKTEAVSKEMAMTTVLLADVFALKHVASSLLGVADAACARTVAGSQWLQSCANLLAEMGHKPVMQKECEGYRFVASKVYYSSFYVIVNFKLGDYNIQ
ncbi:unnamed protein product, partial [Symbiodinium necroappetens]